MSKRLSTVELFKFVEPIFVDWGFSAYLWGWNFVDMCVFTFIKRTNSFRICFHGGCKFVELGYPRILQKLSHHSNDSTVFEQIKSHALFQANKIGIDNYSFFQIKIIVITLILYCSSYDTCTMMRPQNLFKVWCKNIYLKLSKIFSLRALMLQYNFTM